jgi:tRNA/rRNA methyltransferase
VNPKDGLNRIPAPRAGRERAAVPAARANLAVVLVETRNPLNIGAAARAMSNFGFFDLRLVNPYGVAFREAVSAVGAEGVVREARVFASVAEAVADRRLVVGATGLRRRTPDITLHRLERAGRLLRSHLAGAPAAILFGCEKFGLSNDDLSRCNWLLRIPTRPEHESMNLAQAVAVCLYELVREPGPARRPDGSAQLATAAEVDRLTGLIEESLQLAGHTDFTTARSGSRKTHELVRRLNLRSRDAAIWTGMVRHLLWRLRNP